MSGLGPGDLHDLADEFLQACIDALDTIPLFEPDLLGAPDRTFIAPGLPVWDCCEQMAVYVTTVSDAATAPTGLATGRRASFGKVNHVRLNCTITRCIPTIDEQGRIPSSDQLTETARQVDADGWALWNHVFNEWRAGNIFTLCTEVFFDGLIAANPLGGCGGWNFQLRVALDGYDEDLSS
jgi:hypothetical protein